MTTVTVTVMILLFEVLWGVLEIVVMVKVVNMRRNEGQCRPGDVGGNVEVDSFYTSADLRILQKSVPAHASV